MGELIAKSACDGLLPLCIGQTTLREVDLGILTSVAPYKGQGDAVSQSMKAAHGISFPAVARITGKSGNQAIWFGRDMALLVGPQADVSLSKCAALTDQSDAWVCVELGGDGAEDVLARLVPLDVRVAHFKTGHTARTLVQHMNASITRTGSDVFLILVFRAMAQTLVHELKEAMEGVAARG